MKLWNVGGKVADLDLEETFLRAMGADVVGRQPVFVDGEEGNCSLLRSAIPESWSSKRSIMSAP